MMTEPIKVSNNVKQHFAFTIALNTNNENIGTSWRIEKREKQKEIEKKNKIKAQKISKLLLTKKKEQNLNCTNHKPSVQ